MVLYAIIMLLAALPMGWIGIEIYRGKTDLIHDYHQKKVSDKAAYGRAFGKAMLVIAGTMLLSGIISLLGKSDGMAMAAVGVLFIGLIIGIICIVVVQRKYNKGIF